MYQRGKKAKLVSITYSQSILQKVMLKNKLQFYLIITGVIILFDVAASFSSKSFEFDYTSLSGISLCLYFIFGYLGCKFYGISGGILAGLVAGFADSTIGWLLSSLVGAYLPFEQPDYTFPLIVEIIFIVTLGAIIFGLFGAVCQTGISKLRNR